MKHHEPVTKIMSCDLITVHHGDPISKVRQIIRDHHIHHVPVVSGDQFRGLISWTDLQQYNYGSEANGDTRALDATLDHTLTIEQLMSRVVITLSENSTIREAAELLAQGTFHSLPVVNAGKLVGMVTTTDLVRYLVRQF